MTVQVLKIRAFIICIVKPDLVGCFQGRGSRVTRARLLGGECPGFKVQSTYYLEDVYYTFK